MKIEKKKSDRVGGLGFALFVALLLSMVTPLYSRADSFTATANSDTSAAWPVGTTFETGEVGATTNPLGPFSGTAIEFEGYQAGGSTMGLNPGTCGSGTAPFNPCLVASYGLTASAPTGITSISFTGDAFNGAVFELLNSSGTVLDSLSATSGNVGHDVTYTLLTPGVSGTSFTLDLFDASTYRTYVSDISVATTPEPGTGLMLLGALVLIALVQWRRTQQSL